MALGPGAGPKFSPDGRIAAAPLLTIPPQVALNPIGPGESRRLPVGEITYLKERGLVSGRQASAASWVVCFQAEDGIRDGPGGGKAASFGTFRLYRSRRRQGWKE